MAIPKNLRLIKRILYRLKREYGQEITLRQLDSQSVDYKTGELSRAISEIVVKRACVLPKSMKNEFTYDLAYIAAAKNFTYGGLYETNTRTIIVEVKDIGQGVTIDSTWHVVFEDNEYAIKNIDKTPNRLGLILTVQALRKGA